MPGRGRLGRAPVPGRGSAGNDKTHAVRTEEHCPEVSRAGRESLRRGLRGRTCLGSDPRHDEGADTGGCGLLECAFDALVVHHEEGDFGRLGEVHEARVAAEPGDLVPVRVHAPRRDAASGDGLDRGQVARGCADDGDRAR